MAATPPKSAFFEPPAIIGVDEAGRGPLAGPVVAAAVMLGRDYPQKLDDSKKIPAARRAILDQQIRSTCFWAVGIADVEEIDRINIFAATMHAMTRAVAALQEQLHKMDNGPSSPQILIDGNATPAGRCAQWAWPARAIVGGDGIEPAISAASIVAKEWRDRMMVEAAQLHPQYGWERNKGYGTREHMAALQRYGPTPLHRQSFAPVAQLALF